METNNKTSSKLLLGEYVMVENPNDSEMNGLAQINDYVGRSMLSLKHIQKNKNIIVFHKHVRPAKIHEVESILM